MISITSPTRLTENKRHGKDRFYREFLCRLFFEGFAKATGTA